MKYGLLVIALLLLASPLYAQTQLNAPASVPCVSTGNPVGTSVPCHTNDVSHPMSEAPASMTASAPDVSVVSQANTPVNAFIAGHCTRGCYVRNPSLATTPLCASGTGTAATTEGAGTYCAGPGQQIGFLGRAGAISVVSTDANHTFSGEGYQ